MWSELVALALVMADPAVSPADSVARPTAAPDTAARDTTGRPRVWRQFPTIEVRAPLHDLRSSETVHLVTPAALRSLPADDFADLVRTRAGVVASGEELHVRGGRQGELDQTLDGIPLQEPLRRRLMNVPIMALRSIELVSGGQDAEHGGGLAGVLVLRTVDPTERWSAAWRYVTDAGLDTDLDQLGARGSGPLGVLGLGVAAALDVMGDDTWLPARRTGGRSLGLGWRADNRLLGWLKVSPLGSPQSGAVQVLASREVRRPYDPSWSKRGWYTPCADPDCSHPGFSETWVPGWTYYNAADHLAMTDDRRVATILTAARGHARQRTSLALAWSHASSVVSPDGRRGDAYLVEENLPVFGSESAGWADPFYVYWGEYPLYRETRSDALVMRADHTWLRTADHVMRAGAGASWEDVRVHELDGAAFGRQVDSLRAFHARAPGGFAYLQTRWDFQGLVLNAGLRAQAFTAGSEATHQTLPGSAAIRWSIAPRLGVAYPVSTRDVFSLAYVRLDQEPGRDFLYDTRRLITNRQPLGNPGLVPATVISWQGALKHLFSDSWAAQLGVFYRDVFGQVGARNFAILPGAYELHYTNEDEGHASGFELSLMHENDRRRAELHYTWMEAYGSESRPEGDPYGLTRGPRTPPISDRPLSWDRRHSIAFSGSWPLFERWMLAWSSTGGSALPWTPRERRTLTEDPLLIHSRRFGWIENTDVSLRWDPPLIPIPLTFGLELRNLFDTRGERVATVDGYPHSLINTVFDDYGAYRTETGRPGGAYWFDLDGNGNPGWVPVHDPRLMNPPRRVRLSVAASW